MRILILESSLMRSAWLVISLSVFLSFADTISTPLSRPFSCGHPLSPCFSQRPRPSPWLFRLVPSHWLPRFFRAYLRDTYLPELSGNLTPVPSPGRSPPFRRTPIRSFETISCISRPLHMYIYVNTFTQPAFPMETSDRTLSLHFSFVDFVIVYLSTLITLY